MSAPEVHLERILDGTTAVLTLDDPVRQNAMTPEMGDSFTRQLRHIQFDGNLCSLIIRGSGDDFSSGSDPNMTVGLAGRMSEPEIRNYLLGFYNRWLPLLDVPVPVIVALRGRCFEEAVLFAAAADIAIADETLNARVAFAKLGVYPGLAIHQLLQRKLGPSRAALILLSGEQISGREAERLGLVERCVDGAGAYLEAHRLAVLIAGAAPSTIRMLKKNRRLQLNELATELEFGAAQQAKRIT
jgi:enoyl-CoA hydratase/carnithine racemase